MGCLWLRLGGVKNKVIDNKDKNDDFDIDFGDKQELKPYVTQLDLSTEDARKEKSASVLLVIRHGNTFEKDEAPRRIGGRTDLPLTRDGAMQLIRLKAHLEKEKLIPERLYTSPMQRTMQSAKLIAPSYEILEFLREIYHGMDENKPEEEVIKRIGRTAIVDWETKNILPSSWTADILGIRQGWQGLKKLSRDVGGVWAAVTSGGIAKFALDEVEDAPEIRKMDTGAYGRLEYDRERNVWICKGWNIKP